MQDPVQTTLSGDKSFPSTSSAVLPSALQCLDAIQKNIQDKPLAFFLDYDGTLTPIVRRPQEAVLSDGMREALRRLASCCPVAVISGRDLADVRALVGLDSLVYAGSHGFDIAGPRDWPIRNQQGIPFLHDLDVLQRELEDALDVIAGSALERKQFSLALHYRNVADKHLPNLRRIAEESVARHPRLRQAKGKKVFEFQPGINWNKGEALLWLLKQLHLDGPETVAFYIGDDVTDEDAFRLLHQRGLGVIVREEPRPTAARYALDNTSEVRKFLGTMTSMIQQGGSHGGLKAGERLVAPG